MKSLSDQFGEAVEKLFKLAGEDEILKKNLAKWVNENFRMYRQNASISNADRLHLDIEKLMKFKADGLIASLIGTAANQGDIHFHSEHVLETKVDLIWAEMVTFKGKASPDEGNDSNVG